MEDNEIVVGLLTKSIEDQQENFDRLNDSLKELNAPLIEKINELISAIPEIPEFPEIPEMPQQDNSDVILALNEIKRVLSVKPEQKEPEQLGKELQAISGLLSKLIDEVKVKDDKPFTKLKEDIKKLFESNKIEEVKFSDKQFKDLVKEIKDIPQRQVVVGGGGMDDQTRANLQAIKTNTDGAATEATLQAVLAASGGEPALTNKDYSGDDLIYKGTNTNVDAAEGDGDWTITKFTYVAGAETSRKTLTGSWTNRASLNW